MTTLLRTPILLDVIGVGEVLPRDAAHPDWFDHRVELGPRGYKYLPRASMYVLAAARRAMQKSHLPDDVGQQGCLVVATNHGLTGTHAELDHEFLSGGLDAMSPALAPYFSVNVVSGRVAIDQGITGPSIALHTPLVAGLEAVQVAASTIAAGRATWAMVAATEEPADVANGDTGTQSQQRERGAVAAVLLGPQFDAANRAWADTGERTSVARLAAATGVLPASEHEGSIARAVEAMLARLGVALRADALRPADNALTVSVIGPDSRSRRAVIAALQPLRVPIVVSVGGYGCLAPLHDALATAQNHEGTRVIVAVGATGTVGAVRVTRSG